MVKAQLLRLNADGSVLARDLGNDVILGDGPEDDLFGVSTDDTLLPGGGLDLIRGAQAAVNQLVGGDDEITIRSLGGEDTLFGRDDPDSAVGLEIASTNRGGVVHIQDFRIPAVPPVCPAEGLVTSQTFEVSVEGVNSPVGDFDNFAIDAIFETLSGPGFGNTTIFAPGLRASQAGSTACQLACLSVVVTDGQPGSDGALVLLDPERMPRADFAVDAADDWADVITGIPNAYLGLGVDFGDIHADGLVDLIRGVPGGHPADLCGDPADSDRRGVAYLILGPIVSGDLADQVDAIYGGEQPQERFSGDTEIGDYDGDGLIDLVVTSTLYRIHNIGLPRGIAWFFLGGEPTITRAVHTGADTLITGQHLSADVLADGLPARALLATETLVLIAGQPEAIEVRGLHGAAAFSFQIEPEDRVVNLGDGFNLVGWTGNTPIAEALASVDGTVAGVFVWDPVAKVFRSFSPSAPPFLNTLDELLLGDGLWISVDGPATWTQPALTDARSVALVAGLQIAIWTGPDETPVQSAITGLANAVAQILVWDATAQRFRTFNPAPPAAVNSLATLNHGDAFWIELREAVTWDQPPP